MRGMPDIDDDENSDWYDNWGDEPAPPAPTADTPPAPQGPSDPPVQAGPLPPNKPPPDSPTPSFNFDYDSPSFDWPDFTPPPLPTVAPIVRPPAFVYNDFSYDPFTAPTMEEAQNEPGYAFARDEGKRAFLNSRLATRLSGGTIKDLIGWGNQFAEQNYGNVYNRAANTYGINRANAFGTHQANETGRLNAYNTNWNVDTDVYDRNTANIWDAYDREFRAALAQFDPQFRSAELRFSDIYNRDRDRLQAMRDIAVAGMN